jgi:hypothetical protein
LAARVKCFKDDLRIVTLFKLNDDELQCGPQRLKKAKNSPVASVGVGTCGIHEFTDSL